MLAVSEPLLGHVNDEVVRMSTALSGGVGRSRQEMCGALSAGALLIGALYGRVQVGQDDQKCLDLAARYRDRFVQELGATGCGQLRAMGYSSPDGPPCSALVQRAMLIFLDTLEG